MSETKMVCDKPDPQFLEFLRLAQKAVSAMPSWKRGNLEDSMKASNSYCRTESGEATK